MTALPPLDVWWWLACAGPVEVTAEPVVGGLEVRATRPLEAVEVRRAGVVLARASPARPTEVVHLPLRAGAGTLEVLATLEGGATHAVQATLPALPVWLEVELPRGRPPVPVTDGVQLDGVGPTGARALVRATAREPVTVTLGGLAFELTAPGAQAEVEVPIGPVLVEAGGVIARFGTTLDDPGEAALRAGLRVTAHILPADRRGRPDRTLPADRVVVPGGLLASVARALGLGFRPRPELAPFTFAAVHLQNDLDRPLDLVLTSEVVDAAERPAEAFAAPDGAPPVVVVRVPARGSATASLPVWLDPATVRPGTYQRLVHVQPLGWEGALWVERVPLVVQRSGGLVAAGFVASLVTALGGGLLVAAGGRRFLATTPVQDLVTIATFGAATFVVGAGFQLVGTAFATALGPFAPFVSGLPDDAFRAVLLATLVTTCPRPGVLGAATVVGFLMRGLALGSFHPADLLYVGTQVLLNEAGAWIVGLTRHDRWLEASPLVRWGLLSAALAPANALGAALGLASTAVLYRLWWSPTYAAALVLLPGFLYVVLGCRLAVPVADSLRRVAP